MPCAEEAAALVLGLCLRPLPGSQLQRQALHPHRALVWQQEEGGAARSRLAGQDCPPPPALGYSQAWEKASMLASTLSTLPVTAGGPGFGCPPPPPPPGTQDPEGRSLR